MITLPPLEWWFLMAALLWAARVEDAPKCPRCGCWIGVAQPDMPCRACAALPGEEDGEESNGTGDGAHG